MKHHHPQNKHLSLTQWIANEYTTSADHQRLKREVELARLALKISELRQQHGLSQRDLAKLLHTKQQYVSRIEQPNNMSVTLRTLSRLAEVFHKKLVVDFV